MRLALALLLLAGCSFDPVDLEGRGCPCVAGYVCVDDVCVAESGADAGGMDAGGMDAGGVDSGGVDAGPMEGCPADAFCESFEGTNPGTNGWRAYPDFSLVTYVNPSRPDPRVTPFRGTGMLRVETRSPGASAEIEICPFEGFDCPDSTTPFDAGPLTDGGTADLPGITSGGIYMRAYVYIPSTLPDGTELVMGHASVMHMGTHRGVFGREVVVGFNNDVDRVSMYVGTIRERIEPRPPMGMTDTRPPFPRDEWVCVRTEIEVDPSAGSVATYIGDDSTPEVERTGIDTLPAFPYRHFGVGLGFTDDVANGAELFIDEVAVGRSPISCL